MSYLLETYDLTKEIGGRKILESVSLHVKKGEIYGFLGPNGAGKTTLLKLVTGLLRPTAGEVILFGKRAGGFSGGCRYYSRVLFFFGKPTQGKNAREKNALDFLGALQLLLSFPTKSSPQKDRKEPGRPVF